MKRTILAVCVLVSLAACNKKGTEISDFAWLAGEWSGTQEEAEFFEIWQEPNGNRMEGLGLGILNNDTIFSEKTSLEERNDGVFYTANVSENGAPVDFKYTGSKNDSLVFENPSHDFPQRIVYFRSTDNKLYACIDGTDKGIYSKVEFTFTRKSKP